MSRENSITTVLEINLWNSVGCWNNLRKQGYWDNHKPWLFHATLSATTPKRNIYRPNSNRLSCDYRTEHLNSEDTLQKVCRIPGVSSLSRDSINRQDILDKDGDDDVYDKAAVLLWTEMTPLRISKKKRHNQRLSDMPFLPSMPPRSSWVSSENRSHRTCRTWEFDPIRCFRLERLWVAMKGQQTKVQCNRKVQN